MRAGLLITVLFLGILPLGIIAPSILETIGPPAKADIDDTSVVAIHTNKPTVHATYQPPDHDIRAAPINYFIPPFNSSGGGKNHTGFGEKSYHDAEWDANHRVGELYTKGETRAEGPDCMADAQAWAFLTGPAEGTVKTEKSGNYVMVMFFLLNGAAATTTEGSQTQAESHITISGHLYTYETNESAGSATRTVYHGFSAYKRWVRKLCILIVPVTLSTNHSYYFTTELSIRHHAKSDVIFRTADARSNLNAILFLVLLINS